MMAIICFGLQYSTQAQLFVDDVNICEDPDVKFVEVWLEGVSMSNANFINLSFGQRLRALSPDTRRLKDKKGSIEVYGIAEAFNILDVNGFDFVTIQVQGSGGGGNINNISSTSISSTYIFKRRDKGTK